MTVTPKPKAVLCDVNGTLFSLAPLQKGMQAAGLPEGTMQLWFAQTLRDGIALATAGRFATFKEIGIFHLQQMLQQHDLEPQQAEAIVMQGFAEGVPHDDVGPAFKALHKAGIQIATMTNGSVAITEGLLERAGLQQQVAKRMDVTGPKAFKPARQAYHYAVEQLGLQPEQVMLVAVHPWDCQGAKAAGLRSAYISRDGTPYPGFCLPPDVQAASMTELAEALASSKQA